MYIKLFSVREINGMRSQFHPPVPHDHHTGGSAGRCNGGTVNTAFKDPVDDHMSMCVNKGRARSPSPWRNIRRTSSSTHRTGRSLGHFVSDWNGAGDYLKSMACSTSGAFLQCHTYRMLPTFCMHNRPQASR
jgi:hypothetical protein